MSAYSFLDITATMVGPGGSLNLCDGAQSAEEGITIESIGDKSTMTIGAGGGGMHSLSADESSLITVRCLKTSPVNAKLQLMYNLQTKSSATHGKNVFVVRDPARGDFIVAEKGAFKKRPTVTYAKDGGIMEWAFDAIRTTQLLGSGTPEV